METFDITQDPYAEIYRKTVHKYILFLAHWELTYKCNLRCRHCYVAAQEYRKEFSYALACSIIDELKAMGCLYLALSGGEILMREDFFDLASYARRQGFALRLMTNATLIDEAISSKLASLHPLTVETSIYAADKNLHDAITYTPGSFDKMLQVVTLLKQKNIRVILKFLIMKDNVREFAGVKALAKSLEVEFFFDFCVVAKIDGSVLPLQYRLNRQGIKDFFVTNNLPLAENQVGEDEGLCIAGLNNIFITPYLDVYPCIGLNLNLGNLYQQKLQDIWAHSKELNFLRNMRTSDLKRCRDCELAGSCSRCLGMALAEDGDILGPSSFDCLVAEVVGEVISERRKI